jgi:hypothetical protein
LTQWMPLFFLMVLTRSNSSRSPAASPLWAIPVCGVECNEIGSCSLRREATRPLNSPRKRHQYKPYPKAFSSQAERHLKSPGAPALEILCIFPCLFPLILKKMALQCMFLVLLASLPAARSMPWPGPSQTAQSAKDGVQVPTPTDGPKNELVVQAARRDITVAPNTCGWVNGDSGCK